MNERRRKLVPVSAIFAHIMGARAGDVTHLKCIDGLPADAIYIGLTYDHMRDVYYFCYQSAEWDEIPLGEMLPTFTPQFMGLHVAPFLEEAERLIKDEWDGASGSGAQWLEEYRAFKQRTGWPYSDE